MNKKEVLENLENVYKTLLECDIAIKELNSNGEQIDYCTSSKLSDLADNNATESYTFSEDEIAKVSSSVVENLLKEI